MRRLASVLAALVLALIGLAWAAPPARAASGDVFDSFDVVYDIGTDGVLHVQETIVLRFGSSSGRHGLERYWVTREPYDDNQDVVYDVRNIKVTSLSGVSTQTSVEDTGSGRELSKRLRVGDPNRTIYAPTATYVLSYDVVGAMRSFSGYDEFYWDVTGSQFPTITKATVSVTVPGGVQDQTCSVAAGGQQGACASATINAGRAEFSASDIPPGDILTVSAKIKPGLISDNKPHLVENADAANQRLGFGVLIGSGVAAAIVPVLGWFYYRRHSRDRRFVGLPPGTVPTANQPAQEVADPGYEVPVAFAPPRLPLADAGLLLEGQPDVRHTTATLVGLAVDGAIRLRSDEHAEATLVNPRAASDEQKALLVRELFSGGEDVVALDEQGVMTDAHEQIVAAAAEDARQGRWFFDRNPARGVALVTGPLLMAGVGGFFVLGPAVLLAAPLFLSLLITGSVLARKLRRGQRSGVGRALTDQVEGFRTYLATAEADQLRFEEGEDIFSRYLPWAILFDLTERWTKVCEQLVAMGRLSADAPYWYYGSSWNWNYAYINMGNLNTSVGHAATPAPDFSSGTGFGGGSSFGGGGGFSGGGGGGGGGGSW